MLLLKQRIICPFLLFIALMSVNAFYDAKCNGLGVNTLMKSFKCTYFKSIEETIVLYEKILLNKQKLGGSIS